MEETKAEKCADEPTIVEETKAEKCADEEEIISAALAILEERAKYRPFKLDSPDAVRDYLRLKLSGLENEVFYAVWLDAQHCVISFEHMFSGSLTETAVYPREIVKSALKHNAAAVIFAHNHPSGNATPSSADERLTANLKTALALVDVRVLDHFVIADTRVTSFAEIGLI